MNKVSGIPAIISGCALLFFAGCSNEGMQNAPVTVQTETSIVKMEPLGAIQEDQSMTETEPSIPEPIYRYNSEGRRDPFQSVIVVTARKGTDKHLPPLQRMDIVQLTLIGVVWGGFGYNAILQAADGKGYPIKVGTRIGLNNGVVNKISSTSVVVKERYTNIFGEKKEREITMDLHPQKEELE